MRFMNTPPSDQGLPLPILRCPITKPLRTIIACSEFRGLQTHYLNRQTIPCTNGPECPGCDRNMIPRWQGFVIICSENRERHGLLQFTPPVAAILLRSAVGATGLGGLDVTLRRLGGRINSPLTCIVNGHIDGISPFSVKQLETAIERIFAAKRIASVNWKVPA